MRLLRFKITNFRSINSSNWIDASDNTCLIGTNEAGKTNILIGLWKLNPANSEPIIPLDDYPRHLYSSYKANKKQFSVFVYADFLLDDSLRDKISESIGCDKEQVQKVLVRRRFDGKYYVTFPYSEIEEFPSGRIKSIINDAESELLASDFYLKDKDEIKKSFSDLIQKANSLLNTEYLNRSKFTQINNLFQDFIDNKVGRRIKLPTFLQESIITSFDKFTDAFDGKVIEPSQEVRQKIISNLPKFVYYSDYGNLDSEIYLPRVIEDMERDDISETARAKMRTLEVLFKYVNLSPREIFELGNDRRKVIERVNNYNQVISTEEEEVSEEAVKEWADKKRERGILLRSAATSLTTRFKKWWQQGDYIFDFQADGDHFRINVSDSLRPEKIELEGRSRGLQWFFSFFLVFLVETKEGHSNSILLLDEPGLSLHPIAQFDLAKFFRKLSEDNQLIYTSHSPFLVDIENLANVKAVYLDPDSGRTMVTSNLRFNQKEAEKSIYPAHAALGLTVSDTLLLGSRPILVEGISDQIYLQAIKRILFGSGDFSSSLEFVFIPTGGVRGVNPVSRLVSSRDDDLPRVLLDSDEPGKKFKNKLINGRYKDDIDKVLEIDQFINIPNSEVEDLIPPKELVRIIDRNYRADEYLEDNYYEGKPIVPQIETWANENGVELQKGWKVELAREFYNRIERLGKVSSERLEFWKKMFNKF